MFSPAGLSGLVHVISEFHKQPEVSLMHIFQVVFVSGLLLLLWPKQVLKIRIFTG